MALLAQMFLGVACFGLFSLLLGVTRVLLFYSCCESGLAVLGPAFLVVVPGLWGKIAVSIHLHVTVVVLCALLNGFAFLVCSCAVSFLRRLVAWFPVVAFGPLQLCLGFPIRLPLLGFWLMAPSPFFSSGHVVLGFSS